MKKKLIEIRLLMFQLKSSTIMKKHLPDNTGSDAFKAEMLALVSNTAKEILSELEIEE